MTELRFRIVNVFAPARLAGNPLGVFEDGSALDTATMQALARQLNLSETTFVLGSDRATAGARIFTPTYEMPFAGHPTLGTAHVVRELSGAGDEVTLELPIGVVPVHAVGDRWTLEARAPTTRAPRATPDQLAAMLGIERGDVASPPMWVDTGAEQLLVPLASADAVARARASAELLARHASDGAQQQVYVFDEPEARDGGTVTARFFFTQGSSVVEDPGTGSACANLGGWLLATGAPPPVRLVVHQGAATGRPCELGLDLTADGRILVAGVVIEVARGTFTL